MARSYYFWDQLFIRRVRPGHTGAKRRLVVVATLVAVLLATESGIGAVKGSSPGDGQIEVVLQSPQVTILHPTDGEACRSIENPLPLIGSATDYEDGTLSGDSLNWFSSLDGYLGSGEQVNVPPFTLSTGLHVITLQAEDSDGNLGQDQVTVCMVDRIFADGFE